MTLSEIIARDAASTWLDKPYGPLEAAGDIAQADRRELLRILNPPAQPEGALRLPLQVDYCPYDFDIDLRDKGGVIVAKVKWGNGRTAGQAKDIANAIVAACNAHLPPRVEPVADVYNFGHGEFGRLGDPNVMVYTVPTDVVTGHHGYFQMVLMNAHQRALDELRARLSAAPVAREGK